MKLDVLTTGGFKLYTDPAERGKALALGGKWNNKNHWWTFTECPFDLTDMDVTPAAMAAIRKAMRKEETLISLQSADDIDITHGMGIDPYQRVGVKFLTVAERAILGDFVGLGKSAQVIRACHEVGARKVLIVTKKSYIHNMSKQINLWTVGNINWELTNYEQIARHPEKYPPSRYDVVIVDEAIALKNRKTKRTRAIKKLCAKVPYVWLVAGTLIRNRPSELWSLLNILYPKKYSSYWKFVEQYCEVIATCWGTEVGGLRSEMHEQLAEELAIVLIRRSKDVVDLPPLTEETIYITNTSTQQTIYDKLLKEFYVILDGKVVRTPNALSQLTRLRQVTCCPSLIGGKADSAKTETILSLVEDYAPENKLISFTTYKEYARNLAHDLRDYNSVLITGDVPVDKRNEAVERFDSDASCRILIGTYGAMSESLNIQTANVVIHANPEWVPDQVEQATGRAYRRGQTRPVHVIHLVTENTIEDHIVSLLAQKRQVITELDIITSMLQYKEV